MFLRTAMKLVYNHVKEKRRPKMNPNLPPSDAIRRDSALIADIEEFHLRIMHRLIIKLIQPMSNGNVKVFLILLDDIKKV